MPDLVPGFNYRAFITVKISSGYSEIALPE